MRTCRKCDIEKPDDQFGKNGIYLRHTCLECGKKQSLDYYYSDHDTNKQKRKERSAAAKEWHRNDKLKKRFGITAEEYDRMHESQKGLCAICQKPEKQRKRLAVDHCHSTGKVRKLLCQPCNTVLGLVSENTQTLERMIEYIHEPLL